METNIPEWSYDPAASNSLSTIKPPYIFSSQQTLAPRFSAHHFSSYYSYPIYSLKGQVLLLLRKDVGNITSASKTNKFSTNSKHGYTATLEYILPWPTVHVIKFLFVVGLRI